MNRSYQYRLFPTKTQAASLDFLRHRACDLYNAALQERREAWKMRHVSLNYYDQANQLKVIRQDDPTGIGLLNFSACQQTLRRVQKTYTAFFQRVKQGKGGFPRFKPYRRYRSLDFRFGDGVHLAGGRLVVQNVGPVKVKWHRPLPSDAIVKAVVVTCDATGTWYAVFQIELPDTVAPVHTGPAVGIDLGLSTLAALSTGACIKPPRCFRQAEKELRRQQRHLSRCKRGSHRRKEAVKHVATTHTKIANQRKDFSHKFSARLTKEFSLIAVEDLQIKGLAGSMLAKSVQDAGWSQLLAFLDYKALTAGGRIVKVNPAFTSQACSACGSIVKKTLNVRVHSCPHCGLVLDRDVNASRNILHLALKQAGTLPSDANVAEPVACVV
jgi:putative transposase